MIKALENFGKTHAILLTTVTAVGSIIATTMAYGPTVKSIWSTPSAVSKLEATTDKLVEQVGGLSVRLDEREIHVDTSPCVRFLPYGHAMEDTAPLDAGVISLQFVRLRAECVFDPPPQPYIRDSENVLHDAKPLFSGKDHPAGPNEIVYLVEIPKHAAPGPATIHVRANYENPGAPSATSPAIPFTVLERKSND